MAVKDKTMEVITELYLRGVRTFKAGGALGYDTIAALCVLELREKYPDVRLELELICEEQADGWEPGERGMYAAILNKCDVSRYASAHYSTPAIFARNRNLVNGSDVCVCYLTKTSGGTAYTANYAKKCGLKVINIANI